ncbi:MAG: hypothetical protein KJ906_02850 [Nanoarchaeota archaeon]|nr:hypothetical protein [Nanoarchaeota archaeon]
MKAISPLIGFVLVMAISIAAISIAMNVGTPAIERSKEILIYEEGKNNLKLIDGAINEVLQEGDGSSRKVSLKFSDGKYNVVDNRIEFFMITKQGIISHEECQSNEDIECVIEEDGVSIDVLGNEIRAYIEYDFDFIDDKEIVNGAEYLIISNQNDQISIS